MSKSEILDMKNKEFSKGGELNSLSQIDVYKSGGVILDYFYDRETTPPKKMWKIFALKDKYNHDAHKVFETEELANEYVKKNKLKVLDKWFSQMYAPYVYIEDNGDIEVEYKNAMNYDLSIIFNYDSNGKRKDAKIVHEIKEWEYSLKDATEIGGFEDNQKDFDELQKITDEVIKFYDWLIEDIVKAGKTKVVEGDKYYDTDVLRARLTDELKPLYKSWGVEKTFKTGGKAGSGIPSYKGRSAGEIWNSWNYDQRVHFINDHVSGRLEDEDWSEAEDEKILNSDYRSLMNNNSFYAQEVVQDLHEHTQLDDWRQYMSGGSVRQYSGGGSIEPEVYIADLQSYNEGKLVGKWFKLNDYSDHYDFMEAVSDYMEELSEEQGRLVEEWAVHDTSDIPSSLYSEYMGESDFEKIYEVMEKSEELGIPAEVILEWVGDTGSDIDRIEDAYFGEFEDPEDMAYRLVEEGVIIPSIHDVYVTDTDRRIVAGEEANYRVDDMRDTDLIDYADMENVYEEVDDAESEYYDDYSREETIEEFVKAKTGYDSTEEVVDEAREKVRDQIYDEWYDGLEDPYSFLVEEQGIYAEEDLKDLGFVNVDYEKVAQELGWDFNFIYDSDNEMYAFRSNYKKGGSVKHNQKRDSIWASKEPHELAYRSKRKSPARSHKRDASRVSQEPHEKRYQRKSLGGFIAGSLIGGYIGYKAGRAQPQKFDFETEKKVARAVGRGAKKGAKKVGSGAKKLAQKIQESRKRRATS
jgi:antirestriction protein